MRRRTLITTPLLTPVFSVSGHAAEDPRLSELFGELESNPRIVEETWQVRDQNLTRGVGQGRKSDRRLTGRPVDMIIRLEVSSRTIYNNRYTRPIWPQLGSGVTIGIGYDLRFANRAILRRDWERRLSEADLQVLERVVRLRGSEARDALPSVQEVVVPYDTALAQFVDFLPYPTAQTEDVFPNTSDLSNDSFGALVSLVYNRGPDISRNSESRREMYEISELMRARQYHAIPNKILEMRRLWPRVRGLIIRRELEARLFELGFS